MLQKKIYSSVVVCQGYLWNNLESKGRLVSKGSRPPIYFNQKPYLKVSHILIGLYLEKKIGFYVYKMSGISTQ